MANGTISLEQLRPALDEYFDRRDFNDRTSSALQNTAGNRVLTNLSTRDGKLDKERLETLQKEAEFMKASLEGKKKIREEEAKILKLQIESNKAARKIAEEQGASKEELLKIDVEILNLQSQHQEKMSQAQRMEVELGRALKENVSWYEKKAAVQNNLNKYKEKENQLQKQYNLDVAKLNFEADEKKRNAKSPSEIAQIEAELMVDMEELNKSFNKSMEDLNKDNPFNKIGGAKLKDAFSAGLSDAFSEGSATAGLSSALGLALGPWGKVLDSINKGVSAINNTLDKGITDALSVQSNYLSKVNSRLQGSDESFQSIQQYLYTNFGDSPFISQKKTLENIAQLVDTGTAENIKERGILMTLSDRMVSTFNALDGTLLRLNRLQQADLTASQLGYEGILTNFLNEQFGDTSYLSTLYDSIAGTILDATSQLDSQTAGAFNFAVQKWLGSLYAVGMSEQGINTIAQGLNYLATGNVEAFNSNEGLRNLFAGASGSAFSGILTGGLNAETVDSLMMSIVEYLKEIAGDTNTVTRQARAGIFGGFSLSDIRSIQNLTASQLYNIYDTQKTYDDSRREVRNQLINAATLYSEDAGTNARAPLSMVFDNMVENVMYGFGVQRMSDPSAYSRWRIESMIANSGIPGLNLGANVVKLIDNIFSGDGAFGNLVKGLWNVADTMVTADWANELIQFMGKDAITSIIMAEAPKHRGNADDYLSIAASNTFSGLSVSERLGLATDNLMDLSATAAATSEKTTYAGGETARDITDLYSELFERQTTAIKVSLANIDSNAATALDAVLRKNSSSNVQVSDISEIALEALSEYLGGQAVKSIADKVTTAVDVNVNTNFVDDLTQSLMYSRSL